MKLGPLLTVLLGLLAARGCHSADAKPDIVVTPHACGRTKACLQPAGCTDNKCPYFASWKKLYVNGREYMEFELEGEVISREGYIAITMSPDTKEGDDAVVACHYNPESSKVEVLAAYIAPGKTTVDKDFNKLLPNPPKDYLRFSDPSGRLGGTFKDYQRRIECRFQRLMSPESMVDKLKDLRRERPIHFSVIRGPSIVPGARLRPPFGGAVAPAPKSYDLVAMPVMSTREGAKVLAKTHGCLMILAWILCSSIAWFLARYYKTMWPNSRWYGERTWLQISRSLRFNCLLFTIVAIILIFVHANGWAYYEQLPQRAHPILGIIVFILALIHPLISLCRCRKDHKDRPIYNWIHFLIAMIAHILSIPTIMIGFRMPDSGDLLPQMDTPHWILIFYVLFQFILEIILEIHGCIYYRKNKEKEDQYEADLRSYETKIGPKVTPRRPEPSGRTCKMIALGLYCTITAAVAFALVIIVAIY